MANHPRRPSGEEYRIHAEARSQVDHVEQQEVANANRRDAFRHPNVGVILGIHGLPDLVASQYQKHAHS